LASKRIVINGLNTSYECCLVTLSVLNEAASICWQVVSHARNIETEVVVIDDVDVGAHAGRNQPAIVQAVELGSLASLTMDDEFKR
jgi:hypothetical protein